MRTKMRGQSIKQDEFLKRSQFLSWHRVSHSCLFFTGKPRNRRIEDLLRYTTEIDLMKSSQDPENPKLKIYAVKRICKGRKNNYIHGLGITEGLVRLVLANREVEIITLRWFKKNSYNILPEFGLKYPHTVLYYEFCTQDNSERLWNIKSKIARYQELNGVVLFVMDIQRESVIRLVEKLLPGGQFWFIDYQTFKQAPYGEQLTFPYYINGGKGEILPLK